MALCMAMAMALVTLALVGCGGTDTSSDTAASDGAQEATEDTTESIVEEEHGSRIGIIGAMDEEVATLKEALTDEEVTTIAGMDFYQGKLEGKDVVVVKSNIGKVNAAVCAQVLVDEFDVGRIINTGVAGSLDARIDIGDIVVSTDAVQHDYDLTPIGLKPGEFIDLGVTSFTADAAMRERALDAVAAIAPDLHAFEGTVCSGDQFIASDEQKDKILSNFDGLCCEMEGAAIAQVCYINDVPFVILRAISDKADDSATMDYAGFEKDAAAHCASIVEYMVADLD